jgi:hypothetical protein
MAIQIDRINIATLSFIRVHRKVLVYYPGAPRKKSSRIIMYKGSTRRFVSDWPCAGSCMIVVVVGNDIDLPSKIKTRQYLMGLLHLMLVVTYLFSALVIHFFLYKPASAYMMFWSPRISLVRTKCGVLSLALGTGSYSISKQRLYYSFYQCCIFIFCKSKCHCLIPFSVSIPTGYDRLLLVCTCLLT